MIYSSIVIAMTLCLILAEPEWRWTNSEGFHELFKKKRGGEKSGVHESHTFCRQLVHLGGNTVHYLVFIIVGNGQLIQFSF